MNQQTARPPVRRLFASLRRIFGIARPYRGRLAGAILLTSVASVVWLVVPLGLRALLDAVFEQGDRSLLNAIALGLLALFLVQAGASFAGSYLMGTTGARIVTDLRRRVFDHLAGLGLTFFTQRRTGELTSRLTNDVGTIRGVVTDSMAELLRVSLSLAGSLALMLILNWRLSAAVLIVVPFVTVLARLLGRAMRKFSRRVQDLLAETTAIAEETFGAIRLVKAFTREPFESDRFGTAAEALFDIEREQIWVRALYGTLIGMLFFGALVGVFWFGGVEVLAGRLSAGDLVAFIFYAMNIARSVSGASNLYSAFSSAAGASERLFEVLDEVSDVRDEPGAIEAQRGAGAVSFDGVTFSYDPDRPVLQDITFSVEPGQTIALVGPSGAGKTTLLNLIPRFFDPIDGRILLDGVDIRSLTLASHRHGIAVVPQEVFLFNATVRDNLRYGRLNADDASIRAALVAAHADEFVDDLSEGLDTRVGERGITLSGGQRQRLAIARALLRDASVLLLDEPTSSLDSTSEALIQDALDRLRAGRTTFIIAHRLSTVIHADRILVLDEGRLVQTGTHAELMAVEGRYRDLAERQFRDPSGVSA